MKRAGTLSAGLAGVAVWGPGLPDWDHGRAMLRGDVPAGEALPTPPPAPAFLAPNERRRSSAVVRLALHLAEQAVAQSGLDPAMMRAVFASSNGDGGIVHTILETLASGGDMSPTAFHNSVHNAAAGYWGIGHHAQAAATAISGYDDSFAAGLLKALAELHADHAPVLLCVYDVPLPDPLHAKRRLAFPFGIALVLVPGPGPFGTVAAHYDPDPVQASDPGNPAARALPLLQAIARMEPSMFALPYLDAGLHVDFYPC